MMTACRCILAILVAISSPAAVHAQHVHPGHVRADPASAPASRPSAVRWATDAPLRAGMRGARDVLAALEHGRHGHLDPAQVRSLATQLQGHVQGIFAHCKLEPKADAALHDILLPLLSGARALAADPGDMRPLDAMQGALVAYAAGFDDPAFQPR